jgi:hypothetical protein
MKLALPNSVSSLQDLSTLINEVKEYGKWWTHNAIKHRAGAKKGTPPPVLSEAALELIRASSGKKLLDQRTIDNLIKELEGYKKTAPTATVTLAAPAPKSVKLEIVTWFRENIDPSILVTFEFNSTLLGGMVVRYGSRVLDWSFRRQILAGRGNFPEVLRRV